MNQSKSNFSILEKTFYQTDDLNVIIQAAAAVLQNPIMLMDSCFYMLSHSTLHIVDDYFWLDGLKRGVCTYEHAAKIHAISPEREDNITHTRRLVTDFGPYKRMMGALLIDQRIVGYYSVMEFEKGFDKIPDSLFDNVLNILSKSVSVANSISVHTGKQTVEAILSDLLNRGFDNRSLLYLRIQNTALDKKNLFQIITINMTKYQQKTDSKKALKDIIHEFYPNSWSISYKQFIVILKNTDNAKNKKQEDKFDNYLNTLQLRAGYSDEFHDLFHLPDYFYQATRAIELASMISCKSSRVFYNDYKLYDLISDCKHKTSNNKYCSNAVLSIQKYDIKNNTQYLQTLFHYLDNGNNIKDTAKTMFLHRNTIVYRIERLKDLFDIDFNNSHHNILNYISFLLLQMQEVEYIKVKT